MPAASGLRAALWPLAAEARGGVAASRTADIGAAVEFAAPRLVGGALALGAVPPLLLLGGLGAADAAGLAAVLGPLAAALAVLRGAALERAALASALLMVCAVVVGSALSGALGAAGLVWLALAVAEGSAARTGRAVRLAFAAAGLAAIASVGFGLSGVAAATEGGRAALAPTALAVAYAALVLGWRLAGARRGEADAARRLERDRHLVDELGELVLRHAAGHRAAGELAAGDCVGGDEVAFASGAARRVLGVDPADLLGRGFLERVDLADRPAYLKALAAARAGGEGAATVRARAEGGEPIRTLGVRAARLPVLDADGRAGSELVTLVRDETARAAGERALQAARATADTADAVKSRFLATVSHELRTPLNAIIGFSELLSDASLPEPDETRRREYARIITQSGRHLLDVVNTLLDVSRIESGHFALDLEPFDAAALARSCVEMLGLRAREKNVALHLTIEPGLPLLRADRRAVRQVMTNLMANAVKFTPGGGRVAVSLRRDGASLAIGVSDTGIGIAPHDLPRIGEPFFQARASYDRPYEGTGLGLSVVKGLVALHDGQLRFDSALKRGTSVSVTLPLAGPDRAAPDAVPSPAASSARHRRRLEDAPASTAAAAAAAPAAADRAVAREPSPVAAAAVAAPLRPAAPGSSSSPWKAPRRA